MQEQILCRPGSDMLWLYQGETRSGLLVTVTEVRRAGVRIAAATNPDDAVRVRVNDSDAHAIVPARALKRWAMVP
jgi:hypothetical protein